MAGAGYKLFNTGDVLTAAQVNTYLQEQVVMVFNDATARTTALSGVLSEGMVSYLKSTKVVEIYNGTAWASLDDPNAIQNTIVDAKGDLISASGNDVPARLAVGNNGETLVADSSATTGLRWSAGNAVGNPVLNSAFQVWQRGTSISVAANTSPYVADRWQALTQTNQATTISRQSTNDTTNLPSIQYCARIQRNSGQTGTSVNAIYNTFESSNSIPYAGKTVTMSFYARAGANYSPTSSILIARLVAGTGTDQNVYVGFTNSGFVIDQNATLTTTWQRFSYTGTVGTSATQLAIGFAYNWTGTAGANDWFEVTGVQIDVGSVALPFRTNGATLAGELAAARRYYVRFGASDGLTTSAYNEYAYGNTTSTTNLRVGINLQQRMRVAPTSVEYANLTTFELNNTERAVSAVTLQSVTNNNTVGSVDVTIATSTNSAMHRLVNNNNTGGYLAFSAEL